MDDAWTAYADLDDVSAGRFEAAATTIVGGAQRRTTSLAAGLMQANDRILGQTAKLEIPVPEIRNGIPLAEVYHRSIVTARVAVSKGTPYAAAMAQGRARAVQTAKTDVILTNRGAMDSGKDGRPWVVGYRRTLTGKSCAFCATASTQRYKRADLQPIHPACDCGIAEIFGREDPGQIINRDLLDDLKAEGIEGTRDRQIGAPYVVDEAGVIRKRTVEMVDGKPRMGAGDAVKIKVEAHPELGQVVLPARDLVSVPSSAPRPPVVEAPPVRRARLAADSPDVVRAAERAGVSPDEVLSARTRVKAVRREMAEAAARVQAEALRELDRFDALKIQRPPLTTARSGTGRALRGGEYDWLEQVGAKERGRLSRQWYSDVDAYSPDNIAQRMSAATGRDISTDEAMEIWLDLNRRAEAAGAVRRGKLPSADAYSGQVDVNDLLSGEFDDFDAERLLGMDDLDAAADIARRERDLVGDEAIQYLGRAIDPVEGPSPWRMSFESWEGEVRDLEWLRENGGLDAAQARRYAEVVPEALDDPGVGFEELYARIVQTARLASEEISPDAVVRWAA